jgi:nickel/cobalt transporter (NicO) family protein
VRVGSGLGRAPLSWLVTLAALALASLVFLLPANSSTAAAHPLGNFSINRLSVIEVAGEGVVDITYLVDMAEIPTFQARGDMDPDGDGVLSPEERDAYLAKAAPGLLANLSLDVSNTRVALESVSSNVELLEGQGGLSTARIAIEARGRLPDGWRDGTSAAYEDRNFGSANGWRQVIVKPGSGIELLGTSAPAVDVTKGLTEYPTDLLKSPPAVTSATFEFRPGVSVTPPTTPAQPAEDPVSAVDANKTLGRFAALVSREHLTPAVITVALLLSVVWGAMHALGPGHGKTVVAAYLVGERGTGRHALYLGLIVTATHTISVFALGAIAIFASDVVATDDIYYWLSLGSGLLVAVLGGALLAGRARRLLKNRRAGRAPSQGVHSHTHADHEHPHEGPHYDQTHGHEHDHDHEHKHQLGHDHDHEHGHSHVPAQPGWRGIVALGVAGGIVPCPTALVVMLGAIALDRAVLGLAMVTAFSAGLAGVLVAIGLVLVYGRRWLEGRRLPERADGILRRAQLVAPVLSALTIFGVGLVLTSQALL